MISQILQIPEATNTHIPPRRHTFSLAISLESDVLHRVFANGSKHGRWSLIEVKKRGEEFSPAFLKGTKMFTYSFLGIQFMKGNYYM